MDIKQLTYFISAARHENFTRAAQECFIVQTAMTHQMAALERELGVQLFARSNRRVKLTPAGEVFLGQARRIVQSAEDASLLARAAAEGAKRILRIGCCGRLLRSSLPRALRAFSTQNPDVKVALSHGNLAGLLDQLDLGLTDCIITLEYPYLSLLDWLESEILGTDRLMVAMRRENPLSSRPKLTTADLANEPYILYRERGAAEKILSHAGEDAPINITAEVEDAESTEILVEAGFGISFALEHVCDRTNPNMAYVPFEGEGGQARLLLCWNKRHPQEDIRGFAGTLQKHISL